MLTTAPIDPTTDLTTDLKTDLTTHDAGLVAGSALPCVLSHPADTSLPCWTDDPDLWFAESPAHVEDAKELCVPCPLREACLAGALDRREPWGVWGGQLVVQGVVVPRKRPRGRPRKDAAA